MDIPFPMSPRVSGVLEQWRRTHWLLTTAGKKEDEETRFRIYMLAIYTARAIAEIMLEAAGKQELAAFRDKDEKLSRKKFEEAYLVNLPHYSLIEKIRIHDFHRFGCTPNNVMHYGGPIKMTVSKGSAEIQIPLCGQAGKDIMTTGNSHVHEQRTLLTRGAEFFDDISGTYLTLDKILMRYFEAIGPIATKFKRLVEGTNRSDAKPEGTGTPNVES